jgi:hypothetical protein
MGAMTLTLYTAHLMGLSFEAHYDRPYLWFTVNLAANVLFAVIWQRTLGQGPLERVVSTSVRTTRRAVPTPAGGAPGGGYGPWPSAIVDTGCRSSGDWASNRTVGPHLGQRAGPGPRRRHGRIPDRPGLGG